MGAVFIGEDIQKDIERLARREVKCSLEDGLPGLDALAESVRSLW